MGGGGAFNRTSARTQLGATASLAAGATYRLSAWIRCGSTPPGGDDTLDASVVASVRVEALPPLATFLYAKGVTSANGGDVSHLHSVHSFGSFIRSIHSLHSFAPFIGPLVHSFAPFIGPLVHSFGPFIGPSPSVAHSFPRMDLWTYESGLMTELCILAWIISLWFHNIRSRKATFYRFFFFFFFNVFFFFNCVREAWN